MESKRATGIQAALASAIFLGLSPIFGKQAMLLGLSPVAVVAMRTTLAAFLLFVIMFLFRRPYLYIYPAGLLGCLLAGGINGFGSLLYYSALGRLDVSVGQLLYALYPLFVALWLALDHQPLNRLTIIRMILVMPALVLLTQSGQQTTDLLGVGMMLAASALYALHLPINQRVLYDMPAPTVTLYTLLSMSVVVLTAYLLGAVGKGFEAILAPLRVVPPAAWLAILALTLVTFVSRLMLFVGVKHLGGLQAALLGLGELLVAVALAHLLLKEHFTAAQWLGAIILVVGLGLVGLEKQAPRRMLTGGWLNWLRPPGLPADIPWQPHE